MGRAIIVVIALIIGLTILTLLCFTTLYFAPNLPFNPLSPARATASAATRAAAIAVAQPTATPPPTYPPTWTPTHTFTPAPTKTVTDTRTPTPTRTDTPTPTSTSTRTPTRVPPTNTPTITPTSTPLPYFVASHSGINNCADIGLWGMVNNERGLPQGGVTVQYGEVGVAGSAFLATTDFNGRIDALLIPGSNRQAASRTHTWYAYIIENGQQRSPTFLFQTDPIYADNPPECEDLDPFRDNNNNNGNGNDNNNNNGNGNNNNNGNGNGNNNNNGNDNNNNNEEREFRERGCLPDPCLSSNSTQVKVVDWQEFRTSEGPPAPVPEPQEFSQDDVNCADFASQEEAQLFYEENGGPTLDIFSLDPDRNGIACESLPPG